MDPRHPIFVRVNEHIIAIEAHNYDENKVTVKVTPQADHAGLPENAIVFENHPIDPANKITLFTKGEAAQQLDGAMRVIAPLADICDNTGRVIVFERKGAVIGKILSSRYRKYWQNVDDSIKRSRVKVYWRVIPELPPDLSERLDTEEILDELDLLIKKINVLNVADRNVIANRMSVLANSLGP